MIAHLVDTYRGLNWWNKFVLSLNLMFMIVLLLTYVAPFVNPNDTVLFAYLGLLYPVNLIVNLLFVFYWIFLRKHIFLYSLVVIMLGMLSFSRFFQMTFFQTTPDQENQMTVMSFNVRLFDLYNWSGNKKSKDKIEQFILQQNVDVVCFQEFYRGVGVHFSVNDFMKDSVGYNYCFEHITTSSKHQKGPGNSLFGSAIFSKYPFVDSGYVEFTNDENNHISWIDVVKDNDTIRMINAHIGSMRLQNADYKLIGGNDNKKWAHEKQYEQDIFTRVTKAFYKRADQIDVLCDFMENTRYEMVLCVDLNDTPNSYAYNRITKILNDAFVQSGWGIGSTYVGENVFNRIIPINRIDYIFHAKSLTSRAFVTHQEKLSDHKAISCEIYF